MHIHAEHNGVRYDCNICFKQFKRKGSLDRHMAGVHKKVSLKSGTHILLKQWTSIALKSAPFSHKDSSVFKCAICLKEFKQKSHLKTHMKNVHHQELAVNSLKREPSPLPTQVPHHSLTHQGLLQHQSNFPAFELNVN